MTTYPDDQGNPAGAIPVYLGGGSFDNIAVSEYTQVKSGAGVLGGVVVGTAGTGSAVSLYDGESSVVTITLGTPGIISWPAHGLLAGTAVQFSTTGALPTGMTAGTTYYVSTLDLLPNSFVIADTQAHALAGTNSINTSVSQSGVQSGWDVSEPIVIFSTAAQGNLPLGVNGATFDTGLIAHTTDGGGAANITVLFR